MLKRVFATTGAALGALPLALALFLTGCGGGDPVSDQATAANDAPPALIPAAPAALSATGGANQMSLSWPAVAGATSYNIYWSPVTGVTTANGIKIASVGSPHLQSGLSAGTRYHYIVTAQNSAGEGAASPQATASTDLPPAGAPARPVVVTASAGLKQITVFWPSVAGATSYNIYYSTSPGLTTGNGTRIAGVTAPQAVTGLSDGTTYYLLLTAQNASGESVPSAGISATTLTPVIILDGLTLYNQNCFVCHGNARRGRSAAQIQNAISNIGSMQFLRDELTPEQIAAIAATTPAP